MNKHTINTNETASVETREGSNIYIYNGRGREMRINVDMGA